MVKRIGIYSKSKQCGKTTTAVFLAESLATMGKAVLFVNANGNTSFQTKIKTVENTSNSIKKVKLEGSLASWSYLNWDEETVKDISNFEYQIYDLGSNEEKLSLVDSIIIPIEASFYGFDDIKITLRDILNFENLKLDGILLTMYEPNEISKKIKGFLDKEISSLMLSTIISRNYYLGLDFFKVDTITNTIPNFGYADYLKLANELIEKNG